MTGPFLGNRAWKVMILRMRRPGGLTPPNCAAE